MRSTRPMRTLAILATVLLTLPAQATLAAPSSPSIRSEAGCATTLPADITTDLTLSPSPCATYTSAVDVTVEQGSTLTVMPGVTVSLSMSALNVRGRLLAQGAQAAPVIFTGPVGVGSPRHRWNGIVVGVPGQDIGANVLLRHTIVEYGRGVTAHYATLQLQYSIFRQNTGDGAYSDHLHAGSSMTGCRFANNTGNGLSVLSLPTSGLDIVGNSFVGNYGTGLYLVDPHATIIEGNGFRENTQAAFITTKGGELPDVRTNWGSNNAVDAIGFDIEVSATLTIPVLPSLSGLSYDFTITVDRGATLTITPGMLLPCESLNVYGTLLAAGTPNLPITFTNGLQASTWPGLSLRTGSSGSVLDHSVVEHAVTGLTMGTSAQATITHSVLHNNTGDGIVSYNVASSTLVQDNVLSGNGGFPMEIFRNDFGPNFFANVSGNTGSNNAVNVIALAGTLTTNWTWSNNNALPYGIATTRFGVPNAFAVSRGVTLTLPAGVTIAAGTRTDLWVQGTLMSQGSATNPVTLTAISLDPTLFWGGLQFVPGSTGLITATLITHSDTAIYAKQATITIHNSTIISDAFGISNYGQNTPIIQAQNNWWGDATGPAPYGKGVSVTANVAVTPWLTQ